MKTNLLLLLLFLVALTTTAQEKDLEDYWQLQNTNFSATSVGASDISIVDENVVWIKGHDGSGGSANIQVFTKTTDGGATWTSGTIDIGSPASGIAMIHGISATTAWIVAFPHAAGQDQGIFKTTDGGANWVKQASAAFSDPAAFANVVYFWDENKGFCQGDPVDGYYELYTTNDGGANWTRVPSGDIPAPTSGEYGYTSQIFVTGDALWWTTNKGRIYRSYDFGHTFEVFQSPIGDFGGASERGEISFKDNLNGYLINQDGTLWLSSDGGENWDITFPDSGIVFGGNVFAIPGSDAVVTTGAGGVTGSSFSINGGIDWTIMSDVQHLDVRFLDENTGWTGGFNGGPDGTDPAIGGVWKFIGSFAGISDVSEIDGFEYYPNPVNDVLTMSAKNEISNVEIFNMLGQVVLTKEVNALTTTIDTSELANGTYVVQVTIGDVVGSMKIMK